MSGYRQLIVMRHAKAEQDALSDKARRLTPRGRADASAAGEWLVANGLAPGVAMTSPAVRAQETAELVGARLDPTPEVRVVEDLYGASSAETIATLGATGPATRCVLLVGHNPTLAELAHQLQRDPADPWAPHLPTAGLVVLELPGEWADLAMGTAELTHWHVPRG